LKNDIRLTAFTLSTLALGFQSENEKVVEMTSNFFLTFASSILDNYSIDFKEVVWKWFISSQGGLDSILYAIHRYQFKSRSIERIGYSLIYTFSKNHLGQLFSKQLPQRFIDITHYCKFASNLLPIICENITQQQVPSLQQDIKQLLIYALDCLNEVTPKNLMISSFQLFKIVWTNFSTYFEAEKEIFDIALSYFEKAVFEEADISFHPDLYSILFGLLHFLIKSRNQNFKIVYNVLISALSSHFHVNALKKILLDNFVSTFETMDYFPVNKLLKVFLE
jgi:hypothetical protein